MNVSLLSRSQSRVRLPSAMIGAASLETPIHTSSGKVIALQAGMGRRSEGMVLLGVLFVLLALLVLSAPFLAGSRDATRQGAMAADGAQARLTLRSAQGAARARLGQSHPSLDATPDGDSYAEILGVVESALQTSSPNSGSAVAGTSQESEGNGRDGNSGNGILWGVQAEDESGRIDLNSASPQVLANVLGWQTRLAEVLSDSATTAQVASTGELKPDGGVLVVDGEWIQYEALRAGDGGTRLIGLIRGLEAEMDPPQGPLTPAAHAFGAPMIDQRIFAFLDRRIMGGEIGKVHRYDVLEELRQVPNFAREPMPGLDWQEAIMQTHSTYVDEASGPRWQNAERIQNPIVAGETLWIRPSFGRFYAPGTTVRIQGDGVSELRYITARRGSSVALNRVTEYDYRAESATIAPMVRKPVNLNTASPRVIEALVLNLALAGRNERITKREAAALTGLILSQRPFAHREDFLRRIVLVAAGLEDDPEASPSPDEIATPPIISSEDAIALYINGLNANDSRLAFGTMPFAFTSRDVYRLDLRASVQAENGLERVFKRREVVERVVPQRPLLALFHRQEDFERGLVLDRNSPWWMTGPEATSPYDGNAVPPSRAMLHLGTRDGQVAIPGYTQEQEVDPEVEAEAIQHVYAEREPGGWAQLWPARRGSTPRRQGRMRHFDFETSDLEGRAILDRPIEYDPSLSPVSWIGSTGAGLLPGFSVAFWMRLVGPSQGTILEMSLDDPRTDHLELAFGGNGLELSLLDTFGDHPATAFEEIARMHIPVAPVGPSIAPETWGHVQFSIQGNQPTQMDLFLDGMRHGVEVHGLTRTTFQLTESMSVITVESTVGFPPQGVARIGSELVEYVVGGPTTLNCTYNTTGPMAGFGGRAARHKRLREGDPTSPPVGLLSGEVRLSHPIGTIVEHYGYSIPLRTDVPQGQGQLSGTVGPFRVARVMGVGDSGQQDAVLPEGAIGLNLRGLEKDNYDPLVLALADNPERDTTGSLVMEAFHPSGGYALLVQGWGGTRFGPGVLTAAPNGTPIGGVEVIRYSGKNGNELIVAQRGAHLEIDATYLDQARAFIIDYGGATDSEGTLVNDQMARSLFCVPISIPVNNAGLFPEPTDRAKYVQLTHTDAADQSEWVRYDQVQTSFNQLVRIDVRMVDTLPALLIGVDLGELQDQVPGGGGTGGVTPQPPSPPAALTLDPSIDPSPVIPVSVIQGQGANTWTPTLGVEDPLDIPRTHAVSDAIRFRGVCDTKNQSHQAGTLVVPVFEVEGRLGDLPGAQDPVFLDAGTVAGAGAQTSLVHRSYATPIEFTARSFTHALVAEGAQASNEASLPYPVEEENSYLVALGAGLSAGISMSNAPIPGEDQRLQPRLVKFPSGERPLSFDQVVFGAAPQATPQQGAGPAAVVIDELLFDTKDQGNGLVSNFVGGANSGAGLILGKDMNELDTALEVRPGLYAARGKVPGTLATMSLLRGPIGLGRIGDEVVCYIDQDEASGVVLLADFGRGLLGTQPSPHCAETVLYPLQDIPATVLVQDFEAEDEILQVAGTSHFPSSGTLLVGDEIVHYTRKESSIFWMPRGSLEPGLQDASGLALFRGRYGTTPSSHLAGTPVILFPTRYWDRWQDQADVPELGYLGLRIDQASARFEEASYQVEANSFAGVRMGALLRGDPLIPWDADPETTPGLFALNGEAPNSNGDGQNTWPLNVWSDQLEARFYVVYEAGALDLIQGSSHSWKYTPRLTQFAAGYHAPSETLRSVDR